MTDERRRATMDRYGTPPAKSGKQAHPRAHTPASTGSPTDDKAGDRGGGSLAGRAKSLLLAIVDRLPLKPDSKYSTALLRHYVEGSGDPVSLSDLPMAWQDHIIKSTRARPGHYRHLSSYDVGLYDMQNSLGHFDVAVVRMGGGENLYSITDVYEFGFQKGDRRARHGFPLGDRSDTALAALRAMLPSQTYWNPGGFEERWEIRRVRGENILFIPQQFLARHGVPFEVRASFRR